MATTLATIQAELQGFIGETSSDTATRLARFANYAGRQFWHRHPWRERRKRFTLDTVAPYTTGTSAVSGTAVTGTGTTFTSAMDGRKFARDLASPHYVFTRTGATTGTLGRSYLETTTADAAYTIFQDVAALDATADVLLGRRVRLLVGGSDRFMERVLSMEEVHDGAFPQSQGYPAYFWDIENSAAGLRQIQMWPVPDAAYAIEYECLTKYTDIAGSAEWVVPDRHASIVIDAMERHAFRLHDDWERAIEADTMFFKAIDRAWQSDRASKPGVGRLKAFDSPVGRRRGRFGFTP